MQATVTVHEADVAVLALHGELDSDTAAVLHSALDRLLDRPTPRIVVDLAGLRFCDSVGLSAFLLGWHRAGHMGGWLRLAAPGAFLEDLLTTVGLTRYLPIYRDVRVALEAC
jgi:anti-sigma B factor antagonist